MEYWHEATEKLDLPHCQTSTAAQFGALVTLYLLLPIKDQVYIILQEATHSTISTT